MRLALSKINLLSRSARFDVCSSIEHRDPALGQVVISKFGGKRLRLLKLLYTNICAFDCKYCVNRAGRRRLVAKFSPDELASLFARLVDENVADGLFLSSGLGLDPVQTMEEMLETVELIRFKQGFDGYVHLKVLPGASYHQVKRACELANRVSVNQEAPSQGYLSELSSQKDLENDIIVRQRWMRDVLASFGKGGQTTQYVVGAAGESDLEILRSVCYNYLELDMDRAYFSAFAPVPDTPLGSKPPTPSLREHRLYQADFLLRIYRFELKELVEILDERGMLPLNVDPKLACAVANKELFPLDVNEADFWELIRVPGIGLRTASRLVRYRSKYGSISSRRQLKELGVVISRALPFIRLNGWQSTLSEYLTFSAPSPAH